MRNRSMMQSVIDNLCRCFGADPTNMASNMAAPSMINSRSILEEGVKQDREMASSRHSRGSKPATPDGKRDRRTKSLGLQDKQWDNLFSSPSKKNGRRRSNGNSYSMEQAHALAKAKLEASQPTSKRKRRRGSRDDIFRTKKPASFLRGDGKSNLNPVNRFLSSHPAIMNSLCFASPVKDSKSGEPAEVPLRKNSIESEANTLHTADDTVSSTVFYENTKLAGMQQKTPPMPLFDSFQVEDRDGEEIQRIVATHSHSSQRLMELYRKNAQNWKVDLSDDDTESEAEEPMEEDDSPPPMTHSSSESSRSSTQQRRG